MTESYLLSHMQVQYDAKQGVVMVKPLSIVSTPRFLDANATLQTSLFAEIPVDSSKSPLEEKPPRYRLFLSMRAVAWGGFTRAIDTLGASHTVQPYTSYIRQGQFFENVSISLTRDWLEAAAGEEAELLIMGPKGEVSVLMPTVYPAALLRYVDESRYRDINRSPQEN